MLVFIVKSSFANFLLECFQFLLLLLILDCALPQLVLQINCLRLHLRLFSHESFLFNFEIRDYIFQVADGFMQEISCIVLMSNLLLQLVKPVIQLVSLGILGPYLGLKVFHLAVAVFLQLLLVFFELNKLVVEHLNFLLLGRKHILMVPLKSEVVHFRVTLVTNALEGGIVFSQLTALITACFAD